MKRSNNTSFCSVIALACGLFACHQAGMTTAEHPMSEHRVAEWVIDTVGHVFLPVIWHGKAMNVALDIGTPINMGFSAAMFHTGIPLMYMPDSIGNSLDTDDMRLMFSRLISTMDSMSLTGIRNSAYVKSMQENDTSLQWTVLDSLTVGTTVAHNIPFIVLPSIPTIDIASSMYSFSHKDIIGMFGFHILTAFDLEFDGPANRVRVYEPLRGTREANPTGDLQVWLPKGIVPADCLPMRESNGHVDITTRANGVSLDGFFDSGAPMTIMNLAAAHLLGLTKHSPNVHVLPLEAHKGYALEGETKYRVTGLTLTVGSHRLADIPVDVMASTEDSLPWLRLGMDAIRDRTLFLSLHSGRACLSGQRT